MTLNQKRQFESSPIVVVIDLETLGRGESRYCLYRRSGPQRH